MNNHSRDTPGRGVNPEKLSDGLCVVGVGALSAGVLLCFGIGAALICLGVCTVGIAALIGRMAGRF